MASSSNVTWSWTMSEEFVKAIDRFAETEGVDLITVEKGQRKDDVAQQYLAAFEGDEGGLFIGKAQEKAQVFRTEKRRDASRRAALRAEGGELGLRQVGTRSLALRTGAIRCANDIRRTGTPAARWIAADALRELQSPVVARRVDARATAARRPLA